MLLKTSNLYKNKFRTCRLSWNCPPYAKIHCYIFKFQKAFYRKRYKFYSHERDHQKFTTKPIARNFSHYNYKRPVFYNLRFRNFGELISNEKFSIDAHERNFFSISCDGTFCCQTLVHLFLGGFSHFAMVQLCLCGQVGGTLD